MGGKEIKMKEYRSGGESGAPGFAIVALNEQKKNNTPNKQHYDLIK
jgi:hypothetical protein